MKTIENGLAIIAFAFVAVAYMARKFIERHSVIIFALLAVLYFLIKFNLFGG